MSLIQNALEKALLPEAEVPKPAVVVAEEPRMQTIQFYETVPKKSDTSPKAERIRKKKESRSWDFVIDWYSQHRPAVLIGGLILLSLLIGRTIMPVSKTTVDARPISSPSAIVKTQTVFTQKTLSRTKFTLTGITEADGILLALINNQVVGAGDRLRENAVVKTVSQSNVILEYDGQPVTLTL